MSSADSSQAIRLVVLIVELQCERREELRQRGTSAAASDGPAMRLPR